MKDKGCCYNAEASTNYCSSNTDKRLACDVAPDGDENGLRCDYCGGLDMPCCLASGADAKVATPGELALGQPMCQEEGVDCMLDQGNPTGFGKCVFATCFFTAFCLLMLWL